MSLRRRRPPSPARPARSRSLPNDLQAEESLLGAMLLSRDAIAAATEILSADDFYKPAHGHIFDAITTLNAAGEPADVSTVSDVLRRAGLLEAIGGPATLVMLQSATPATSNAGRYAKIVEEHALLRRLIRVAGDIAEMGYDLPDDVTKAVDTGRVDGVRGGPAPGHRHHGRDPRPARRQPRPARAALRAGRVDHRRAHRLHRPRRAAVGPAAQRPASWSGPAPRPARRRWPWAWPPTPPSRPAARCWCSRWR